MANRRMISKTIIDSDMFLDMPLSAQCLYFHLMMRADDDGFVGNPRKIVRMIGCNDDDMKLLFVKQYIIGFESGVIVIKHWKIHNYIRSDRYSSTLYASEKRMLALSEENEYQIAEDVIPDVIPIGNQMSYQRDTQVRLGKDSIGKDSKKREKFIPPTVEEVAAYCNEKGYTSVDPELFVSYYDSNNWMIGKTKMKKWQSAVVTWVKRDAEKPKANKPAYSKPAFKQYETDEIDLSIFEE